MIVCTYNRHSAAKLSHRRDRKGKPTIQCTKFCVYNVYIIGLVLYHFCSIRTRNNLIELPIVCTHNGLIASTSSQKDPIELYRERLTVKDEIVRVVSPI